MAPVSSPPDNGGEESVEFRLIRVSERLERASSDLQTLVDQLRASFQQSSDDSEQDRQDQRDEDQREDDERDARNRDDDSPTEGPNATPSA